MPVRSTGEDSRPTEDNARRPVSPRPAPLWAELPANADASTVEVAYTGAMHAVVAAGMEDIEKGYSHMMHFVTPQSLQLREQLARVPARLPASFARPSLKFSRSNTFDSTGVMVGTQEADMQFPAGTSFTPYMVLRNNTASAPPVRLAANAPAPTGAPALPAHAYYSDQSKPDCQRRIGSNCNYLAQCVPLRT